MSFMKEISFFHQEDGEKISLSMKVVNQTTGKDLDPNNVQARYVVNTIINSFF